MSYQVYRPHPRLAPYVRFFWALECEVPTGEEFIHRTIADGSVEMVFHYRGAFSEIADNRETRPSNRANIQAQSTRFRRFCGRESFGIFGVYLYPFAIPALFSIAAPELTDISLDLVDLFGIEAALLDEEIAYAAGNEQRVAILNRFLLRKLETARRGISPVHQAVHIIMAAKGITDVSELARLFALSRRQFERRFKELAGLSPRLYSQVIRFQAATQFRMAGMRDLTTIAHECGYYDQSHFINEFRRFSGYTPKEYFWNEAEGTQYMDDERMSHFSN